MQDRRAGALLGIIYLAFISLGLPDGILGVSWPAMRAELGQPLENMAIITTLLLFLSAFSSFVSGRLLARWGTGKVTFFSGLMTGFALLGYSFAPGFFWIVLLAMPLGFGQGAVDSGLNLYVAEHYSSRHMNWLHCFWGVGASLGPLVMSWILGGALGGSWRIGYRLVSSLQLTLSAILLLSLLIGMWKIPARASDPQQVAAKRVGLSDAGSLWIAVGIFFVYTGVESAIGLWFGSVLMESRAVAASLAGLCVTVYYASIMGGRFLSGILVSKLGNMRMIRLGLLTATVGVVCAGLAGSFLPFLFLGSCLCGLGLAPVYPCLMHETPLRFQKQVSDRLIGYQVGAACLGSIAITSGTGILLARVSLELLFVLMAVFLVVTALLNEMIYRRLCRLEAC